MVRVLAVVFAFVAAATAANQPGNWKGWLDTAIVNEIMTAGTVKYGSAWVLTDGEDVRLVCKANDTAAAGFANDSLNIQWGYQLGCITLDSTGARDTSWPQVDRIVVDTLCKDSLGKGTVGTTASSGTVTQTWNRATDTTSVKGWAVQSRWIVPPWAEIIRPWANGLTGQRQGKKIRIVFEKHQRNHVPTGK